MSVGGGLGALQFFGHLKRALELFISVRMSPCKILGPLGRYDNPWGKKTNKHASVICLLAKKIQNSTFS